MIDETRGNFGSRSSCGQAYENYNLVLKQPPKTTYRALDSSPRAPKRHAKPVIRKVLFARFLTVGTIRHAYGFHRTA
jgi:hypothetical protein